jgi:putative oxidoreductase
MLGWFGGLGFSGTMGFLTGSMHIPAPLAFLAMASQFFGGLGLILGFLTRIAAFGIALNMLVAIATVHRAFGLFMDWYHTQKGEGFEYHLLVLAMTTFLMIRGAGAFRWIAPSESQIPWEPLIGVSRIRERSAAALSEAGPVGAEAQAESPVVPG